MGELTEEDGVLLDGDAAHVGQGVGIEDAVAAPDWREAHRQLQRIARRRAALDADEARWLVAAKRARVHVELGFGSFREYLERLLGYEPRTARERVRVAEALEELPAIRDALARGAVSFSAVRELTRVAEPETERAWLAAIDGKTVREIEELVVGRAPGDRPTDPQDRSSSRATSASRSRPRPTRRGSRLGARSRTRPASRSTTTRSWPR